jgi:alkanesulfonate monooxygenase SsuD/methylene tetrahydromethanopterin reductase-like flavin-dependent oxidoreductase (luciferase family)
MKVGLQLVCQAHASCSDAEMFMTEAKLAVEAEAMGFDFVGLVEHHFTDYAMCPDNAQALSWIAAKTSRIQLMPAAFILPWNDPLRVVEKAVLLDLMSGGRAIVGMGRGLSRREFRGFRVDMGESRERFDEAVEIIVRGLETGVVEADGKFFRQPRVEVRPRPNHSFRGRTYMVGMSPSSVEVAARLGLATLKFSNAPWKEAVTEVHQYRDSFRRHHGRAAPPFVICDFMICFDDRRKVEDYTHKYFRSYFESVFAHYELGGDHFEKMPSYAKYAEMGRKGKELGADRAYRDFIGANLVGTPEEIVELHQARKAIVGDYDLSVNVSFGSMPYADVWEQARLFADQVMPRLKA